ncbi:MAG: hypothetical protein V1746_08295 [bacterium]
MKKPSKRVLSLLALLLIFVGILLLIFRPSKPIVVPTPTPTPQPTPEKPPVLVFYTEKALLPASWLEEWEKAGGMKVEQRLLTSSEGKPLPLDGDVYSLSPRHFNVLRQGLELASFDEGESKNGANPAFTGYSFDPDSQWTRPWRWTPYFFYFRNNAALTERWWAHPNALWPDDMDLLIALQVKQLGQSANAPHNEAWDRVWQEIGASVRLADEGKCWQALQEGQCEISLLPAALRLQSPDIKDISWRAPSHGAMVQLDVLVIAAKSPHMEQARKWVEFLIAPPQQKRVLPETGYFPTHTKPGEEWKGSPIPLPSGEWFDKSEFLLPSPVAPTPQEPAAVEPVKDQNL